MTATAHKVESVGDYLPYPADALWYGTIDVLDFLGYFTDEAQQPVKQAIDVLTERLRAMEEVLAGLQAWANETGVRISNLENLVRTNRLIELRSDLERQRHAIELGLDTAKERNNTAFAIWQGCDAFVGEPALWRWTDVLADFNLDNQGRQVGDTNYSLGRLDFRTQPTLNLYISALLLGLTAIELDTGGNLSAVTSGYGDQLRKHIAFCRARYGYNRLHDSPQNPAEEILSHVECTPSTANKYALGQRCEFTISCLNKMVGKSTAVAEVVLVMPPGYAVMCTFPEQKLASFERDAADGLGVGVLAAIADLLETTLTRGTVRPPFIGRFEITYPQNIQSTIYEVAVDGTLNWYFQDTIDTAPASASAFSGPKQVGSQWQQFGRILPAGDRSYFALRPNGELLWYRHDGASDGSPNWSGGTVIRSGLNEYVHLAPGGDGILYATSSDGRLWWLKFGGWRAGGGPDRWVGPTEVGTGWATKKAIFATDTGIIYVINDDGSLSWWQHVGRADGTPSWLGPKTVGHGWQNFKDVFAGSDGVIFALTVDGDLMRYRHLGVRDGADKWGPTARIGHRFVGSRQLFASIPREFIGPL